jgi:biopolymer transport protein ExbD
MNFRNGNRDEPEINLIPFIDILLVVLIFLMLTTTYARYAELRIRLPVANAESPQAATKEILVAVTQDGHYVVQRQALASGSVAALVDALTAAAQGVERPVVVIHADAATAHQAVVNVMDAARRSGLGQITFTTQATGER